MKFTEQPAGLEQATHQDNLLHGMTNRIRQSLELQEILAATVVSVRSYLNTDRVMMYRFDTDGSGEVIAECIHQQRLPSLLNLHFPADDIPFEAREMFLSLRQRSIVDVEAGLIGFSPLLSHEPEKSPIAENIYYRTVDPCHIEYLKAMGVKSSLVLPIIANELRSETKQQKLWGLLVSHHSEPRTILKRELRVLQQVADQVSIAIAQSDLLNQTRAEKQREAIINQITTLLHTLPTIKLQEALEATIAALGGVGGRLYIQPTDKLYISGDQPKLSTGENIIIERHPIWQNWIAKQQPFKVLEITDLYQEPNLRVLAPAFRSTRIRGLLAIPLESRQGCIGVIIIFRNEIDTEILWAGHRDRNQLQELPKLSFEVWREQKKGQAPQWKPEEILLAQILSGQFSVAIQQQLMVGEISQLNTNLENRVRTSTASLQKSLQLAKVLKQVTDQIRSTLDFETILKTIVKQVRILLNADRVLVYQLSNTPSGEVIVEDVNGNWLSVLGKKAPPECFPDEYIRLYFQGRIRAINNVLAASLSPCHQEFLQSMQVQASLIVPIKMGATLWGLLIAHQCDTTRDWLEDEIELLQQLADQAAIAIQQAQLYKQSCCAEAQAKAQAKKLEKALQELQETQTQLIQSEKMSSLGQLVAGVAHEINNPVNFIYGNLCYARNYTQDLLELLQLYQSQYPQPNQEIDAKVEEIDLEFLTHDLPKILSSMTVGAERIRTIVLSLRNFSRLDGADMKAVDLHEGIDSTLLILQHRLKSHSDSPSIEVTKDYGQLPLVECYAEQINQVFMNIISNAIDALNESRENQDNIRRISITTTTSTSANVLQSNPSLEPSYAIVRIADNGSGMSEEVKRSIFDPFFTTKPVGKGTGLGLAISYQIIVQKHGGTIKCFSSPGKGCEFWIAIPILNKHDVA